MRVTIKRVETQASRAKSNHHMDSDGWYVVGMKIRCRNGLIMKSSVGGWLLAARVRVSDRFPLPIEKRLRGSHRHSKRKT